MKLLLIASDAMEFRGLLPHCTRVHRFDMAADWSRAALLGEYEVVMAANGVGAKRSGPVTEGALARFPADAVVSLGFCGALDPGLRIADIVVGDPVTGPERRYSARRPAGQASRAGAVASLDSVAATAAEKQRLHASGAIAVEMEAAGVAACAEARGLPFFCIKTVTDLALETLAIDFNAALRSDGHFDTIKILASTLRQPWVRLPELLRLRSRCMLAARSLGDFIADCRF